MEQSQVLAVARKEVKYLLSLQDRLYLLKALDQLLIPDAYGDYDGYTVRSVYFDSVFNEDYQDKKDHAEEKKRVRLRIYHPGDETAKFEIKRKCYGRELKESIVVTREDARKILQRDYSVLRNYDHPAAQYGWNLMTARCYRPVSLIEYDRRAYTHPDFNTRVTMDQNLRYCPFCYDLFSEHLNFRSLLPKEETILEIKYDRFLFRQIQEALQQCDLSRKPPSKFGSSRKLLDYCYH